MGTKTGIEWTDSTWSPIRARVRTDAAAIAREKGYTSLVPIAEKMAGHVGQHCEHVSPGCNHCYAETNNHRCLPANGTGLPYDRCSRDLVEAFVDEKVLLQPLKWGPVKVEKNGQNHPLEPRPRRIFVENQSDLFAEWVTDEMLDQVFAVMALCPQHIFQVLTKRSERMLAYLGVGENSLMYRWGFFASYAMYLHTGVNDVDRDSSLAPKWPLPNVWLGVTVENQAAAKRIWTLLETPAAVRFVSCEPLLGTVDLDAIEALCKTWRKGATLGRYLDWVICGGESGPGARPMDPDWARSLREQCAAAGVPFFFKQWGEWRQREAGDSDLQPRFRLTDAGQNGQVLGSEGDNDVWMQRVGKKAAGSLLDGVEHKAFPEVRA